MIPETARPGEAAHAPSDRPPAGGIRGVLSELFPASPARAPSAPGRRSLAIAAQVAAVGIGAVVLLLRVPGRPSWETIYGEDYWEFFTQAIQQPWHLFITYNGYWQFLPRLIAQFVRYLPLAQASLAFAVSGAVIAACCALFIVHASAGHIRSVKLRAPLAAALVLFPPRRWRSSTAG